MSEVRPSLSLCRDTVADFWRRIEANDSADLLKLFHADAVSHDPVGSPPITTAQGHFDLFEDVGQQFSSIRFRTETVYEAPPFISARWFASAVLTDGTESSFDGLDVFEIGSDGLIHTHWGFWRPDDAVGSTENV